MNCKNCNTKVNKNYCPNCGQPTKLKRIDAHYVMHEIEHVLHFDRRILFTIKELLIRPGESIRHFISENRNRLVRPILFVILTSLMYSLIIIFFHSEDSGISIKEKNGIEKDTIEITINSWIKNYYGYLNIIMGMFIAFWIKLFFRKYNYYFFETLILLCFIIGIQTLISSVFELFQGLTHIDLIIVENVLNSIYLTWAIGQFFGKSKFLNYVKAFSSYLLGMVTIFLAGYIGGSIYLVIKYGTKILF